MISVSQKTIALPQNACHGPVIRGEPVLEISGLRVSVAAKGVAGEALRRVVVHDSDFLLPRGASAGLVGESGSGKTMTVMAVADLLPRGARIEAGRITLGGVDLTSLDPDARRAEVVRQVGVIFQNPQTALNHRLTIGAQLVEALPAAMRSDPTARRRRARELLDMVRIANAEKTLSAYTHELSGGLNQRAAIAMALARMPRLLIADEATTALDASIQMQILAMIDELRRELDLSVLLVSHDIGVIADHSDIIHVMKDGRLVEDGITTEVLARPKAVYTAQLLQASPMLMPAATPVRFDTQGVPLVRLHDLSHDFPTRGARRWFGHAARHRALKCVSLQVHAGETVGIVGESGSGKTTLARIIAGMIPQQSGELDFGGEGHWQNFPSEKRKAWRQAVQYVFQDPWSSIDPRLTIGQTLAEPIEISKPHLNRRAARDEADRLLDDVQLPREFADRMPSALSGGQRQRVAIARALATMPRLLIADEPVSALDLTVQARILALLRDLVKIHNLTLLMISHDLAVIRALCSRVVVMRDGEIVESGPTAQIFAAPQHEYTRLLLAALPGKRLPTLSLPEWPKGRATADNKVAIP